MLIWNCKKCDRLCTSQYSESEEDWRLIGLCPDCKEKEARILKIDDMRRKEREERDKKNKKWNIFIVFCVALAIASIISYNAEIPVWKSVTLVILAPVICILIAIPFLYLFTKWPAWCISITFIICAVGFFLGLFNGLFDLIF